MLFVDRPVLMVVSDRRASSRPIPVLARLALAGGADLFQVREKDLPEPEIDQLVQRTIAEVGSASQIIVNGHPAIAERYQTGLHLPDRSNVILDALDLAPGALLGRSVHRDSPIAQWERFDYLIAGHVFPTASKPGAPPLGLAGLRQLTEQAPVPVLAIGGISPLNAGAALEAGAKGTAIMSAINANDDPFSATQRYRDALDRSWERRDVEAK